MIVTILVTALAFAIFAFGGVLIARTYYAGPPIDNPPPIAEPPIALLVAAAAVLGGVCAYRGVPAQALTLVAATMLVMAAVWYTDATRGIIPDTLTLVPLAALLIAGLIGGRWYVLVAAAVPAIPFAFMAWRTHGIGIGWGDVKLAALGGVLLGAQDAILAFAVAALLAIVIAKVRRTAKDQPVAFAPYLTSAIVIPLCLH
jgi:prepilin signal peptidase PulO-like enzyme (type II secretory pathway)